MAAAVAAAPGRPGACTRQQMARNVMGRALALDADDGVRPMHWAVTFLVALAIMVLAALGAALIHYNFLWTDSLGIGMGVFVLVGAFMLYRIFFWHD
jgi:hypothetical protein